VAGIAGGKGETGLFRVVAIYKEKNGNPERGNNGKENINIYNSGGFQDDEGDVVIRVRVTTEGIQVDQDGAFDIRG